MDATSETKDIVEIHHNYYLTQSGSYLVNKQIDEIRLAPRGDLEIHLYLLYGLYLKGEIAYQGEFHSLLHIPPGAYLLRCTIDIWELEKLPNHEFILHGKLLWG